MVYVKMCGTWYKYPHTKKVMSSAEHKEFHAVVNIGKLQNGKPEVFNTKATTTEIFELGQQNLDELDEWELDGAEAVREVKLKRLVQIVTKTLAHQDEAENICEELFGEDVAQAAREVCLQLPKLRGETEIAHLLHFFGMPSDD